MEKSEQPTHDSASTPLKLGKVYLVGAGPGDPGLITLRGVECLRRADVVLYDYLVNPLIVRRAAPHADTICLGRHGYMRQWTQEEINLELVALARAGKTVVRLKGGDPGIFGRVAEECEPLRAAGIEFEIVPGVSTAVAAGSFAGIPVTHRDVASAVAFVTGQEDPQKTTSSLDYRELARFPGTLVFYMGVTTAPTWTSALMSAGKSPDTPAAIVRRCSLPDQRVIQTTLGQLTDHLVPATKLRPPVIVIIGSVVQLAERLDWFQRRPLWGTVVLVTRPADQIDEIAEPLRELGAEVLVQPAIEIGPPADWTEVDAALRRLADSSTAPLDWIVFSSGNGVRYFLQRLWQLGLDHRVLGRSRLAAIGPGTAAELARHHLRADLQPLEFRAESLAEALEPQAPGRRFLLVRASRGRDILPQRLAAAGADVVQVVAYASTDVREASPEIARRLEAGEVDWVTVTSSAIARSTVSLFGKRLAHAQLASISPITTATLLELGFAPTVEAAPYTIPALLDAICQKVAKETPTPPS
jgi:uroporphyrinogen III methyltransferase/synthase